jgi:hypothetical protein
MFGVEATYWGLGSVYGSTTQSLATGSVSTPLLVNSIEFAGMNGMVYFDGADEHFVDRRNEIYNLEINLFTVPGIGIGSHPGIGCGHCHGVGCGSCTGYGYSRFSLGWAFGVRFFRFEENYLFGSLDSGYTWGEDGGIHEVYLEDTVRNNLIGLQFGFDFSYYATPRWRIFAAPKFGIYDNHVEHYFGLRRGDGVIANPTAASGVTGTYPIRSSEDVLAFLTEIDLGLDWRLGRCWSVYFGYRLVVATGIALSDHQIPAYVVDFPEIADIDTNGNLLLHGAFAGVTFRF